MFVCVCLCVCVPCVCVCVCVSGQSKGVGETSAVLIASRTLTHSTPPLSPLLPRQVVASGVSIVLYIVMEVRLFLMTRKYRKVANNKEMSAILETADEVFTENGGLFLMDWLRTARPQDRDRLQRLLAAVVETARNKEAHYLELLQPQVAPHMFAFRRSLDAEDKAFLDHMLNFLENHNGVRLPVPCLPCRVCRLGGCVLAFVPCESEVRTWSPCAL